MYIVMLENVRNESAFCEYSVDTKQSIIFVSEDKEAAIAAAKKAVPMAIVEDSNGRAIYRVSDDGDPGLDNHRDHKTAIVLEVPVDKGFEIVASKFSHYYAE